ncbi:Bacterial Ig-like domain (group 2) [uncultured archaeon]|nr:Bacterial Ig-like domain (group 2) [uncultured archaeon]
MTDGYGSVSSANFTVAVSAVPTPTPTPPPPVTPVLTTITVSPATASVVVGNTQSFTASPKDQFGNPIAAIVTWSSSNTSVGTITSSGLFTAMALGMTAITATSGSISGTATVTVIAVPTYMPPTPTGLSGTQGNFWINYTWQAGSGNVTNSYNVSVNGTWINGSFNTYNNNSVRPHGWSNISVYSFNSSGTGTLNTTAVSQNTQVANNPVTIGNVSTSYTVTARNTLSIYPTSSDPDGDTSTFARNFTNGTFYTNNGTLLWTTTGSDIGIHSWQINVTDGYGSVSSANFTVTVIAQPPVLTIITVSPATASVVVGNTQNFTASPKDQFGNPIAANVTWSSSNTSVGTITSAGLFTAIAPGMTAITATSGNVSGISIVTVTISPDTTPPLLIVTQPIDNQVFITSSISVSGTATDASGIANVKVNGIPVTVSPSGSFSTTVILVNGSNTITITATDASPNANTATVTRNVTFTPPVVPDTTPPLLIVTYPIDGHIFTTNSITMSGFATDASGIFSVTVNGAPATITGDLFTFTLTLIPGTNTIDVVAIDSSSNRNRATVTRTVTYTPPIITDTTPPTLFVNQPTNGQVFTTSSIAVSGTATDDSGVQTVSVNGAIIAISSGPFNTNVFLIPGTNTISVKATDNAGNTAAITRTATYSPPVVPDTTPPTLVVNQPTNGQVFTTSSITVSGTAFDSSGIYSITVNGNAVSVDSTGSFSTTMLLASGSNTITIAATDDSPNANTAAVTRMVTYAPPLVPDTTPPLLIVSQPADGQVFNTSSIIVSGTATDDSGIRSITVNGLPATLTPDGKYAISLNLNTGSNKIVVQAIDSSSNLNTNTTTLNVTRIIPSDTEPPVLIVQYPGIDVYLPDEELEIKALNNTINVYGTVSDDTGVESVIINGITATLVGESFNVPISLTLGRNVITITATDNSTNHNSRNITRNVNYSVPVSTPGNVSNITLASNPPALNANGKDSANIVAHITDANGIDVVDGTNVTFTTSDGRLYLSEGDADILPGSMTLTAQTNNGLATVVLFSSTSSGTAVATAHANNISASLNIAFKAIYNLDDKFGDTTLLITHSPAIAVENCSIEINRGIGSIRTSTEIAVGIVSGTRISYNIGASTINITINNPIILGDQVIFTVDSIQLDNPPINTNFTGVGNVGSKVSIGINNTSKLSGMIFVMSLHPNIEDDLMARGGTDAGLVPPNTVLTNLDTSLGITDVENRTAFVIWAQLDGATAQDILEVPISMTVSGNWYRNKAASAINNVSLAEIYPNGTVGMIQTPQSFTYDSVNDSYTFVFRMKGFSTFALIGTAAAPSPVPTSVSVPGPVTGGGGGAGAISPEPLNNIDTFEIAEEYLGANVPASYIYTTPNLVITEVLVTPAKNFGTTSIRVEMLKDLSKIEGVTQPSGIVYKYADIWAGAKELETEEGIIDAFIGFKVDRSWLAENNLEEGSIRLLRWDGSKWVSLETEPKSLDEQFVYYIAKTNGFSPFAIVAVSLYPSATIAVVETPAVIKMPIQKITESGILLLGYIIIALILISLALYKLMRYKKRPVKVYEKAMKIKPEDADAWYNRGFDLYEQGKYDEAIKAYDKAIEIIHKSEEEKKN